MSKGIAETAPAAPGSVPGARLGGAWIRSSSVYMAFATLVILDLIVTPGFRNPALIRSLLLIQRP